MNSERLKARLVLARGNDKAVLDCVNKLSSLGFEISSSSKRGVNFSGNASLFTDVFKTVLNQDNSDDQPVFEQQPVIPEDFCKEAQDIYFPGEPELFRSPKKES